MFACRFLGITAGAFLISPVRSVNLTESRYVRVARHPGKDRFCAAEIGTKISPAMWSSELRHLKVSLTLQTRREVRDHGYGLADLLGNHIQQDFLAVGRDVEEARAVAQRGGRERLSGAKLQSSVDFLYRHGKNRPGGLVGIVEFLAIAAPLRLIPPVSGNLPLALSAAESHNVDFRTAGFPRCVGEPVAVRGEMSFHGGRVVGKSGSYPETASGNSTRPLKCQPAKSLALVGIRYPIGRTESGVAPAIHRPLVPALPEPPAGSIFGQISTDRSASSFPSDFQEPASPYTNVLATESWTVEAES